MALARTAHRIAIKAEKVFDRLLPRPSGAPIFEPYLGYATPHDLVVRGRVLTALRRSDVAPDQSKWTNFRQMLGLFFTDEVADVRVSIPGSVSEATSDEEGYVTLPFPKGDAMAGWHDVTVQVEEADDLPVICPVMIPDPDAAFGVISDVDDTMMKTGAYSLARNLWTTFTGSALSRTVFPDSIEMINTFVQEAKAPIFYVSSSPWNLHHFLQTTFERVGLQRGPMFLRDLGISETQFVTGTHGDHKGSAIDTILDANPDQRFVLVGDTGQHDAEIYGAAIDRHPDRILAVVLREPGPGPDAKAKRAMEAIRKTGVPLFSAPDFDGFGEAVLKVA